LCVQTSDEQQKLSLPLARRRSLSTRFTLTRL
jgi:hypothetical protein